MGAYMPTPPGVCFGCGVPLGAFTQAMMNETQARIELAAVRAELEALKAAQPMARGVLAARCSKSLAVVYQSMPARDGRIVEQQVTDPGGWLQVCHLNPCGVL